jgi:lysine/ornithine N-monooxygenase
MFAKARKAVMGAVASGLAVLQLGISDGTDLSFAEWRNAVIAALLAGFLVYEVPNDATGKA